MKTISTYVDGGDDGDLMLCTERRKNERVRPIRGNPAQPVSDCRDTREKGKEEEKADICGGQKYRATSCCCWWWEKKKVSESKSSSLLRPSYCFSL